MRKPLIILLLLCFLLQAGGLWLLMYSHQITLKREMRSILRSGPNRFEQTELEFELVKGKPVAPSFEWEGENEFRYNGSIYDVIEKKVTGNTLRVRCIDDKKEAGVIKKMEDLQQKEHGGNKSGPASLQQLLSLLLFHQHNYYEFITVFSSQHHIDHYCAYFGLPAIDVISPPPRHADPFHC